MTNKEIVLNFIDEVFNAWDLTKLDEYMRDDYMQHSIEVEDGKEGFKKFAVQFFKQQPRMDVRKIVEEGDLVFVFFKCWMQANGSAAKVCDIYRLQDGKLAEHWDVVQGGVADDTTASGRGNF